MFDVGGPELLVIVLGVLLLFGPKKIPEIAQMFGKGLQKIRAAQSQFREQINEIQEDLNGDLIENKSPDIKEIKVTELKEDDFKIEAEKENNVILNKENNSYPNSKDFGFTPKKPEINTDKS